MGWIAFAIKLVPAIVEAVLAVERLLPHDKGAAKEDAALQRATLHFPEPQRTVLTQPATLQAMRQLIRAVVGLFNQVSHG